MTVQAGKRLGLLELHIVGRRIGQQIDFASHGSLEKDRWQQLAGGKDRFAYRCDRP